MHRFSFKTSHTPSECRNRLRKADLDYKRFGYQVSPSIQVDNNSPAFTILLNVYTLEVNGMFEEAESGGTLITGAVRVRWLSFDRLILMIIPFLTSVYLFGNAYLNTDNELYILSFILLWVIYLPSYQYFLRQFSKPIIKSIGQLFLS